MKLSLNHTLPKKNLWPATNWSSTKQCLDQVNLDSNADVVFSVNSASQIQNTILDADTTISSLTVNDSTAVTIAGPGTLTISASGLVNGIRINSSAGLTTIASNLYLDNLSRQYLRLLRRTTRRLGIQFQHRLGRGENRLLSLAAGLRFPDPRSALNPKAGHPKFRPCLPTKPHLNSPAV